MTGRSRLRPAAGGGQWVDVAPERIGRWLAGFADRHGPLTASHTPQDVTFTAHDGSTARCRVPFPPLARDGRDSPGEDGTTRGGTVRRGDLPAEAGMLVRHAMTDRRIGVLLVRLGGYAAGVFDGSRLVAAKVGARPVHGRSAAGGWSQRRFARRRDNQAREALTAAADTAARILLPRVEGLEAVVLGGDRRAVERLRADVRLRPLFDLASPVFLPVADPRARVLADTERTFRAVRIHLADPGVPSAGERDRKSR